MSILQKEPTFFILHNHFYKIHTSDYLLDTLFHLNNYFIYLFIYYYYYYYFHLMILSRFSSDLKGFFSLRHYCCFFFVDFSSSSSFLLLLLITWKCPRKKKEQRKRQKCILFSNLFDPKYLLHGSRSSPFPFEMKSVQFTDMICLKIIKGQKRATSIKI